MKYRLLSRCQTELEAVELVLTQKMNNFNPLFPAVITITAVLKNDTPLSNAVLSGELEIEFENRQIAKIDQLPLEEVLNLEKDSRINFNFLSRPGTSLDVLEAEILE